VLLLLFYTGDERYALECQRVVEVVSLIDLKKLPHAPEYVAGLFNYRGQIVPVIDLCFLIQGTPCRRYLSTRIIIVNYQGSNADTSSSSQNQPQLVGLMAERVTDTLKKTGDFVAPGIVVDTTPYLGGILTDENGMIQLVQIDRLLEPQLINLLPPEAKAELPVSRLKAAE